MTARAIENEHSALHGDDLSSLTAINCRRLDLKAERSFVEKTYADEVKRIDDAMDDLRRRESLMLADIDIVRVERARKIVNVGILWRKEWDNYSNKPKPIDYSKDPVSARVNLLQDAIDDIATAKGAMRREYFGLKDYDRWDHQRCDCEYGYGPRHGNIVFMVGLTDDARSHPGLTLQERDDAIWYLRNLVRIQRAEAKP